MDSNGVPRLIGLWLVGLGLLCGCPQLANQLGLNHTLTVTVSPAGSGSVAVDPAAAYYCRGTPVLLTAVSADGWEFSRWEGDLSGSANPATVAMDADKSVQAVFVVPIVTYSVTYDGNGATAGSPPTDASSYPQGATVTVLGAGDLVKTGHSFSGWNTRADGGGSGYQPGQTFAVGTSDVTLYATWAYVEGTWSEMPSGTSSNLYGVWSSGPGNVFAVGDNGVILHYDGSEWSQMSSDTTERLYDVWGASPTQVQCVGTGGKRLLYSGTTGWIGLSSGTSSTLLSVWERCAVGVNGTIVEWDPDYQREFMPIVLDMDGQPQEDFGVQLNAVWSDLARRFAVGLAGTILRRTASYVVYTGYLVYSMQPVADVPTTEDLWGLWGSGPDDVYAVGTRIILHFDGAAWSELWSGSTTLLDAWGSGPKDVLFVGWEGTILRYDGSSVSSMPAITSNDLTAIWGNGSHDVYAVGYGGTILHYAPREP